MAAGATDVINSSREPLHERLAELTSERGPDVMIEAIGLDTDESMYRKIAAVPAAIFLYKLRGSSQLSILQREDGVFYVVKFRGFPGPQCLINEVIGTELIRGMGLPAPGLGPHRNIR